MLTSGRSRSRSDHSRSGRFFDRSEMFFDPVDEALLGRDDTDGDLDLEVEEA